MSVELQVDLLVLPLYVEYSRFLSENTHSKA